MVRSVPAAPASTSGVTPRAAGTSVAETLRASSVRNAGIIIVIGWQRAMTPPTKGGRRGGSSVLTANDPAEGAASSTSTQPLASRAISAAVSQRGPGTKVS